MKKAFGYLRVSSAGQASDERDGLVRQKESIIKYAASNGLEIVEWFVDAITGKTDLDDRPGLQALMTALHDNGIRLVIVEKIDRLARDLMVQESIIADFRKHRCPHRKNSKGKLEPTCKQDPCPFSFEIISTMEPDLCSGDPTRILIRQVLGAFAQYEKSMIVAKLRGARDRARAKDPNYREGRRLFGEQPGEQETIDRIIALRKKKYSLAEICAVLTKEGHKTRDGGKWQRGMVDRILKRA